jgi:hypothetical protein
MVAIPRSQGVRARPTTQVAGAAPSIQDSQIIARAVSGLGQNIAQIGFQLKENEQRRRDALDAIKRKDRDLRFKGLSEDIKLRADRTSADPEDFENLTKDFLSEYDSQSDKSFESRKRRQELEIALKKIEFRKSDEYMRGIADNLVEDSRRSLLSSRDPMESARIMQEAQNALDLIEDQGVIGLDEKNRKLEILNKSSRENTLNILTENVQEAIRREPDQEVALANFVNDEFFVETVDNEGNRVKVNLTENLPFDIKEDLKKKIITSVQQQNKMFELIEKRQEEELQKAQDLNEAQLHIKDINGTLTQEEINKKFNEGTLSLEAFKQLSTSAKSGDVIDNTILVSTFDAKINAGIDVDGEILQARKNKQISAATFRRLLTNTKSQKIDPVSSGRLSLFDLLGASSTTLGEAGSIIKGRASFAYDENIAEFRRTKGRDPNFREVRRIRDQVIEEYQIFAADTISATLAKPQFMDLDLKNNISSAYKDNEIALALDEVRKVKSQTVKFFKKKYKNDINKAKKDPDFKAEFKKIKAFEEILLLKKKSLNEFATETK